MPPRQKVLMKIIIFLFKQDFDVTYENYFPSFDFLLRVAKQRVSLVETIRSQKMVIPNVLQEKQIERDTTVVPSKGNNTMTIVSY